MKTNFFKSALMLAFGVAIFGAFAFNMPEENKDVLVTIEPGHLQVSPGNCEEKTDCQVENNGKPCSFNAVQLRRFGASTCGSLMWKIEQ